MAWTYMLECADGSYYVGSTAGDLERRLAQHGCGEGAVHTRTRLPVRLVWCHEQAGVRDAFLLEKQIQNWSRAKRVALIEGRFTDLPGLAKGRTGRYEPG